jgi:hypothetical protein
MGEHLEKIMTKMCEVVGAKWEETNPKEEGWFLKYSWTEEEESMFKEWFVDYLYKSNAARKEILNHNTKSKKLITKAVSEFLFNYGWKTK